MAVEVASPSSLATVSYKFEDQLHSDSPSFQIHATSFLDMQRLTGGRMLSSKLSFCKTHSKPFKASVPRFADTSKDKCNTCHSQKTQDRIRFERKPT